MLVTIKSILSQFNKEIPYLQPVYETVVNSLEANASEINIDFEASEGFNIDGEPIGSRIIGYTITDNGDGFNDDNRKSFIEYLSSYKQKLGCKGIGRFTWLKIFEDINIESYTGSELVKFKFNKGFEPEDIIPEPNKTTRKTSISFNNVTQEYFRLKDGRKKAIDRRVDADIDALKKDIEEHLLVKLFLEHTEKNTKFEIKLNLRGKTRIINNNSIPALKSRTFSIFENISNELKPTEHNFKLYYDFVEEPQNNHQNFYCANERKVIPFTKNLELDRLPDNSSTVMLLTSDYFDDDRVNNERNEFKFKMSDNNANLTNPIPGAKINEKLKKQMEEIILEKYPSLKEENNKTVQNCIEEYPHLSKYIKEDTSTLIKNKKNLIDSAKKAYENEKETTKHSFAKMLQKKKISSEEYYEAIKKINSLSAKELAQYFVYRDQIIQGLKRMHEDKNTCEADLHNLFMQMGDVSIKEDEAFSKYDTNVWLLDDKFMSFTGIFSDKQIKKIREEIATQNEKTYGERKEPDLTIFYNNTNTELRDLVVVEFKALDVSSDRKMVALSEVTRNLGYILKTVDNVKSVYGYVVTKLDEEFCRELEMQPGVKPLFSNGNKPLYYVYNDNLRDKNNNKKDSHIYFLSADTICSDAEARNQTFLDIIKNA